MALNPSTNPTMTGRITAPSAGYPYGSSRDESSPGAGDGTPYFSGRANDIFGLQQFLLSSAGIVPNGNADTALDSQYFDAMWKLFNVRSTTINVASDADITLTAAQNLFAKLIITDTGVLLTTGRNVVVDDEGRFVIVVNQTAQTLTVKTSGGSGVPIPAAAASMLVNDGTNVTRLNAVAPASDYEIANKKYVDDSVIGGSTTKVDRAEDVAGPVNVDTVVTGGMYIFGSGGLTNLPVGAGTAGALIVNNGVSESPHSQILITNSDDIYFRYGVGGGPTWNAWQSLTRVSDFAKSHATEGYQKIVGGFTIQWGVMTGTSGTEVFPIAFPTACLGVWLINDSTNSAGVVSSFTAANFVWSIPTSVNLNYLAIGY